MISSSLAQGFEIILAVAVMTIIVSPILCWVLPDRTHHTEGTV
ncbi:MAG: hypothetical protein O2890_11420 [Cyanobacteria bacterium]|nr:hypothetical protein [Cyanobacteriota bacterium]